MFLISDTQLADSKGAYLTFTEIQTNYMQNDNHQCKIWSMDDYINYQKTLFIEKSLSNITCSIYNSKEIIDPENVSLPFCNSIESAAKTFRFQTTYFYKLIGEDVPCSRINYNYKFDYHGKNSHFDPTNPEKFYSNHFLLITFFDSMDTEVRTETLVYDTVNFLSAIVGFSCLSVVFTLIDRFSPILNWFSSA